MKTRRTTRELDDLLLNAVGELIQEVGFANINITSVVHKAKIEPVSFYNRFNNIMELFEKYVRMYDYWINDSIDFNPTKNSPKQNSINLFTGLIDALDKDVSMQKILAWEISSDNYITKRTAKIREAHLESLIEYFERNHSDDTIDIKIASALIISGIYYLCLHKKLSTFCDIDFKTKEGIIQLKETVIELVNRVYSKSNIDRATIEPKALSVKISKDCT